MLPIDSLNPQRVFYYFEQLSSIPRGSGNMNGIAQFCVDFANKHNLKYVRDNANNVIIYKNGTDGYEHSAPVILQGHLDMVCQKTPDSAIDFEKDGLDLYIDGDFLKARGTTLGADNGIAVAMVLAILEDDNICHPPIEAVFTTDEEIGMIGASALDMSVLKSARMINLDSDAEGIVTVSCAGGSDFVVEIPVSTHVKNGTGVVVEISGLKGGHSGVEINKNRSNANIIAGKVLNELKNSSDFNIVSINGGDKANAIPNQCKIVLHCENADDIISAVNNYYSVLKQALCDSEPNLKITTSLSKTCEHSVLDDLIKDKIIHTLLHAPNGVISMSDSIVGLVETSLNLGILATNCHNITLHFSLRSNKISELQLLEDTLCNFFDTLDVPYNTFGHYPPWEYRENSPLRDVYCSVYRDTFGKEPKIEAIHAGLECGVFDSAIDGFDCIAIGPALYDIHTTRERLSISSTEKFYDLLIKILEKLK